MQIVPSLHGTNLNYIHTGLILTLNVQTILAEYISADDASDTTN